MTNFTKSSTNFGQGSTPQGQALHVSNLTTGSTLIPINSGMIERTVERVNTSQPRPQNWRPLGQYAMHEILARASDIVTTGITSLVIDALCSVWYRFTESFVPVGSRNTLEVTTALTRITAFLLIVTGQSNGTDDDSVSIRSCISSLVNS